MGSSPAVRSPYDGLAAHAFLRAAQPGPELDPSSAAQKRTPPEAIGRGKSSEGGNLYSAGMGAFPLSETKLPDGLGRRSDRQHQVDEYLNTERPLAGVRGQQIKALLERPQGRSLREKPCRRRELASHS